MPSSARGWLINGILLGSLVLALALGDRLGGAWFYVFLAWPLVLLLGASVIERRRRKATRHAQRGKPLRVRSRLVAMVVATAIVSGLILGGPTDAFIAGLGSTLGALIVVAIQRV